MLLYFKWLYPGGKYFCHAILCKDHLFFVQRIFNTHRCIMLYNIRYRSITSIKGELIPYMVKKQMRGKGMGAITSETGDGPHSMDELATG